MDNFQYFHLCNHQFSVSNSEPVVRTITVENSGDLIDIVIDRARILDIIDVRVKDYPQVPASLEFDYDNLDDQNYEDVDVQDGYFDDDESIVVDYRQHFSLVNGEYVANSLPSHYYSTYLHNRIRWNVKPPTAYLVTAKIAFSSMDVITYQRTECTRCQGNSWYVDLFNTKDVFIVPTGIEYVAQRVIKDLFTQFGSNVFDLTYGTTLQKQMFQMELEDTALFNHIRANVVDVQNKYLMRQAPLLSSLSAEQRLISLTVGNVQRASSSSSRVLLDIIIRTETTTQSLRVPLFGGGI